MIGQDDKNGVRQRINGDPLIILENFKSSDVVLDEKRDGTHIGMRLQTQSEVWLRTRRVIADSNVLLQLTHSVFYVRPSKPKALRDQTHELLSQTLNFIAVARHGFSVVFREVGPARWVSTRERESVVVEVVSLVQNDGVVFIVEEHAGAVALGSVGVRVTGVGELVVDGAVVEESEAGGLDLAEELGGDAVVGDVEGSVVCAGLSNCGAERGEVGRVEFE